MSVTDIRLEVGLPNHPKTKRLVRLLGCAGPWHLIKLWLWVAGNRPEGDLAGMTTEDIELLVDWPEEEGAFVEALRSVGFLEGTEGSYVVHGWRDRQPWAASSADRSVAGKWAALCRRYGREGAAQRMPEFAARMPSASERTAASMPVAAERNAESCDPHAGRSPSHADRSEAHAGRRDPRCPDSDSDSDTESKDRTSSLRSDSSPETTASLDPGITPPAAPADRADRRAERLAQVTRDAITAFNESGLVKSNGGLLANVSPGVGQEKRRQQVAKCLRTAREICAERYGGATIVPKFWVDYFAECSRDPFLSGKTGGGRTHESWLPDFEFLTREATMLKVYDRASAEDSA